LETSAARLLQGHNVCGTNKMQFLCYQTARRIYKLLGLKKTTEKVRLLKFHDYGALRLEGFPMTDLMKANGSTQTYYLHCL